MNIDIQEINMNAKLRIGEGAGLGGIEQFMDGDKTRVIDDGTKGGKLIIDGTKHIVDSTHTM